MTPLRPLLALLLGVCLPHFGCAKSLAATSSEVLEIAGRTLRDNPLGDPVRRRVAIFSPADLPAAAPRTIVYYLPGYGGSSEDFIAQGERSPFFALVQRFAAAGLPLTIVIPDARNRWGGSQYLNSAAQGNYADHVADDVVAAVEAVHPLRPGGRIIAGHSSGGYGALMLGMARQKLFDAVVALSPDTDFEVTHRALVEQPSIRRLTPQAVDEFFAKNTPRPDEVIDLVFGLSSAYAPAGPGRIHWLYDAAGKWQPQVWQRWLDHDPLVIARAKGDAFAPNQRIYLDGSAQDEWGFNLSARKLHDVLKSRRAPVTFEEPPGRHSDRIPERLARGIAWVLGLSTSP